MSFASSKLWWSLQRLHLHGPEMYSLLCRCNGGVTDAGVSADRVKELSRRPTTPVCRL